MNLDLEAEACHIRDRARTTASALARQGHWRQRIYQILRSINVLTGVGLAAITFVPVLRTAVGNSGLNLGVGLAAAILIGDVVIPLLIPGPRPEIFLIFAFYTDSYASQLKQILLEIPHNQRERDYRRGRLHELLRHAQLNFDDLRVRFPVRVLTESKEGAPSGKHS